jgi:hypothetical protein
MSEFLSRPVKPEEKPFDSDLRIPFQALPSVRRARSGILKKNLIRPLPFMDNQLKYPVTSNQGRQPYE